MFKFLILDGEESKFEFENKLIMLSKKLKRERDREQTRLEK